MRANLNEFLLDGLSSLQLRLDHLDELGRPVFGPNIAESGFFKELQEERSAEVKQSRDRPTGGGDTSSVSQEKTLTFYKSSNMNLVVAQKSSLPVWPHANH